MLPADASTDALRTRQARDQQLASLQAEVAQLHGGQGRGGKGAAVDEGRAAVLPRPILFYMVMEHPCKGSTWQRRLSVRPPS
jgi:hypothetical protein